MRMYNQRLDLQVAFPEATNGVDLKRLLNWAGQGGVINHPSTLGLHDPIYDLLRVYNNDSALEATFPEAKNGIDLSLLYCWADSHIKNEGTNANPILVPHASFYESHCA